jgi:hypothetical protein
VTTPLLAWDQAALEVVAAALDVDRQEGRPPTRDRVRARLLALVAGLRELDEEAAASRLLERVAGGPTELRDLVLEIGAMAIVREARSNSGGERA